MVEQEGTEVTDDDVSAQASGRKEPRWWGSCMEGTVTYLGRSDKGWWRIDDEPSADAIEAQLDAYEEQVTDLEAALERAQAERDLDKARISLLSEAVGNTPLAFDAIKERLSLINQQQEEYAARYQDELTALRAELQQAHQQLQESDVAELVVAADEHFRNWQKAQQELQQAREENDRWAHWRDEAMDAAADHLEARRQAEAALTEAQATAQNYADEWQMAAWDRDRLKEQLTEAQGKAALAERAIDVAGLLGGFASRIDLIGTGSGYKGMDADEKAIAWAEEEAEKLVQEWDALTAPATEANDAGETR